MSFLNLKISEQTASSTPIYFSTAKGSFCWKLGAIRLDEAGLIHVLLLKTWAPARYLLAVWTVGLALIILAIVWLNILIIGGAIPILFQAFIVNLLLSNFVTGRVIPREIELRQTGKNIPLPAKFQVLQTISWSQVKRIRISRYWGSISVITRDRKIRLGRVRLGELTAFGYATNADAMKAMQQAVSRLLPAAIEV